MTMESLELRLHTLERRNARLKMAVLLTAIFAVGANLLTASESLWADPPKTAVQDVIRAQRIEVVDTDGKVLAVLGKLTDRHNQTSTGLALLSNDKQVLRLATSSMNDGSLGSAKLTVINPEDVEEEELFSAGVARMSHGIGLVPQLDLNDRESKYMMTVDANGMSVSVHVDDRSYASALSLRAEKDHSATLSLGGLFKSFKVRAIAESDKPRLEVEKDGQIKTFGLGS